MEILNKRGRELQEPLPNKQHKGQGDGSSAGDMFAEQLEDLSFHP